MLNVKLASRSVEALKRGHPERIPQTREKSKDPVAVTYLNSTGFLDFARNDDFLSRFDLM
jgi:hypothetical protein